VLGGPAVLREPAVLGGPVVLRGPAVPGGPVVLGGLAGVGVDRGAARGAARWDGGSLPGPNTKTCPTEMR
jgi:hypothetical protein